MSLSNEISILSIFMLVNPYDGMLSLESPSEQKQSTARDQ